jgi:putative DNA primase/helicase
LSDWILNINTLEKRAITPSDYLFHKLPYKSWDLNNPKCDKWLYFLNDIFENNPEKDDVINFLQEYIGHLFVSDNSHEKALILQWSWWNWKWTLISVVQSLIWWDKNVSNIDLKDINNEQHLSMLIGKLVNISPDIQDSQQLDSWNIKKIISGEPVTSKEVYKKPISFKPYARLIMAANSMPYLKNIDDSISRRFWIIKFTKKYLDDKKDATLKDTLLKELPWIFWWAIEWLKRLNKRKKFSPANCMVDEIMKFVQESDNIEMWLQDEEYIIKDEDSKVATKNAYSAYRSYCNESWKRAKNKTDFYKHLEFKWYEKKKSNWTYYFKGIKINPESEFGL